MAYLKNIWEFVQGREGLGPRTLHEMRTLAVAIDHLLDGKLPELGDVFIQRFKALEQSSRDGHWGIASNYELLPRTEPVLVGFEEISEAGRIRLFHDGLSRVIGKSIEHRRRPG